MDFAAFENCDELLSAVLPKNSTTLGGSIFAGSKKLKTVTIPYGIKTITHEMFANCESLTSIDLPSSITTIESRGFAWSSFKSIELPDSVTTVKAEAFYGSEALESVKIPDTVLTTLGTRAFFTCHNLKEVTLSQNITRIEYGTFDCCFKLDNLVIPDKVTIIEALSLNACFELKTVQLPAGLQKIESGVFHQCPALTDVYFMGTRAQWDAIEIGNIESQNEALLSATIHCIDDPVTYKVSLEPNGGTVTPANLTVTKGEPYGTLPTPTRNGYIFDGWYTDETGGEKITAETIVDLSADQTLYARWRVPTFALRGTITGHKSVKYTQIRAWLKDLNGESFDAIVQAGVEDGTEKTSFKYEVSAPAGQYNFMIETQNVDGYIAVITKRVDIKSDGQTFDVNLPAGQTKTKVTKKDDDAPNTLVGGLDELITDEDLIGSQEVEVELTVSSMPENDPGAVAIQQTAMGQILSYMDLSLQKKVGDVITQIKDTGSVTIEVVVPFNKGKKNNVKVYRYHEGKVAVLTETRASSGEYIVISENSITIFATKFSTYAIGYTEQSPEYPEPEKPTPIPGTSPSPISWKNPFPDVKDSAWYWRAVEFVHTSGLMSGYDNGKFGPENTITRAEFAQIIYNKEGKPSAGVDKFIVVKSGQWYANAVNWAAEVGLVAGIGDGKYAPNDSITREQLATMLWRYAGRPTPAKNTLNFKDAAKASDYAKAALCWANENGIINGKGGGVLDPRGTATRAETAQMLMNYLKNAT